MVEKDKLLVVVSVLEGRRFPKRARHRLVVEARFDGELLSTDPVEHVESPDFTQELAWELDKKSLYQHRLQRASIKIQVYAQDTQSTAREPVGYVVMDLRSAGNTQNAKWHNLLHTKYHKTKPELKLSLYIDDDKQNEQQSFKAREAPARPGDVGVLEIDPKLLKPELNDADGYYQIGPAEKYSEQFVLSVTIAFATNLPQLIPTNIPLPSTGFFFYYSLLGNDVTNETFHDLLNPAFPPERASVRIRSGVEVLAQFFTSQPGIELHLCCGDQSLGSCEVPLKSLLKKGSTEIYMKPVTLEGAFTLNAPNRLKQKLPTITDNMKPVVGVSIVLRKEDQMSSGNASPVRDSPQGVRTNKDDNEKSPQTKLPNKDTKGKQKLGPPPSPPTPHEGSYTETFDTESRTGSYMPSLQEDKKKASPQRPSQQPPKPAEEAERPAVEKVTAQLVPPPNVITLDGQQTVSVEQSSSTQHQIVVPPQLNHFGFSIDLRSIQSLDVIHSANVFLRYTYPFFGSAAPILTQPAVEVRPGSEVMLPQSFCAFNFASTPQQLADTFHGVPLMVEVWDKQTQKAKSELLGVCQLHLDCVLSAERSRAVHSSGTQGWRQTWTGRVPVHRKDGGSEQLCELLVVLGLEHWGPLKTQVQVQGEDTTSQAATLTENSQPAKPEAAKEPISPRQTQEYQVAMELELWKEHQESLFQGQLKQKETQHMSALAEEWKKRDKERELLMKKKLGEYQNLEEKLKKTLADLDKREKKLAHSEQELVRLRQDLQREHERKMTEVREASRRMKEDCDHQVALERNKVRDLDEQVARLKQQLKEYEAKNQQVDKEFTTYREQQNSKPEVRLQSEINLLTLEKVELERKMDAVTKSKVHYKQQWGRALKELARLKQKEQATAKASLKRQQQELEHLRLRYLAAEEQDVVRAEKQQLHDIKQELHQLREAEISKTTTQPSPGSPDESQGMMMGGTGSSGVEDEHITRLIEERDTLLCTGVYTSEDRIISELDRQIREAISRKGREEEKVCVINAIRTENLRPNVTYR